MNPLPQLPLSEFFCDTYQDCYRNDQQKTLPPERRMIFSILMQPEDVAIRYIQKASTKKSFNSHRNRRFTALKFTALMASVALRKDKITHCLLNAGVECAIQDAAGNTVYDYSAIRSDLAALSIFRKLPNSKRFVKKNSHLSEKAFITVLKKSLRAPHSSFCDSTTKKVIIVAVIIVATLFCGIFFSVPRLNASQTDNPPDRLDNGRSASSTPLPLVCSDEIRIVKPSPSDPPNRQYSRNIDDAVLVADEEVLNSDFESSNILETLTKINHEVVKLFLNELWEPISSGNLRTQSTVVRLGGATNRELAKLAGERCGSEAGSLFHNALSKLQISLTTLPNELDLEQHAKFFSTRERQAFDSVVYMPPGPKQIPSLMRKFVRDYRKSLNEEHDPIDRAAWIHMQIVKIQPFENGNHRTARIMMNAELERGGYTPKTIYNDPDYDIADEADLRRPGAFAEYLHQVYG
ncbi:MAG: hypothetical protein K1060chlam2_00082 [Chlamydiae bacterium]|nr:hypothetical protein [Chlamydiota bacterium]